MKLSPMRHMRKHIGASFAYQRGLSLVELMIAMVIGIALTAGMVTVFSGSKRSSQLNATLTELQESARFSMGTMISDIRLAGFQGCAPASSDGTSATILGNNVPTTNLQQTALTGHLVNADGTWSPPAPLGFTPPAAGTPGAPVAGTHVLSSQFGSPETYRIETMADEFAPVKLSNATVADMGVAANDVVLISDCEVANIFTVSTVGTDTLLHAATVNKDPRTGNSDGRLTNSFGPRFADDDAMRPRVMRFEANIYYIGDTQRTNADGENVLALYRQSLPYVLPTTGAIVPPIEMVEGVTNMQLRIGMQEAPPGDSVRFVAPENVSVTPGEVATVELGILLESFDSVAELTDTSSYTLAGKTLTAGTAPTDTTYRADKRMRIAFNSTVDIRNR